MTREELKQDLKKAAVTAMTVLSTLNAPTAQASEQAPMEDDKIIERTEYFVPNKYPQPPNTVANSSTGLIFDTNSLLK